MTNRKHTRRALLSAFMALVMCCSMFVGTTFAWFTDTAKTGVNIIQSGTLDIQLLDKDGKESIEGKSLVFQKAEGSAQTEVLWEPGATYYTDGFTIKNGGSLYLKFKVVVNGITTGNAKLLEAIDFYLADSKENPITPVNILEVGEEYVLAPKSYFNGTEGGSTTEFSTLYLAGHMKEEAGNEYQGLTLDGVGITLYATQYTAEEDSFDKWYDEDAEYLDADKWDGVTVATPVADENGVYHITNAAELAGVNALIKTRQVETGMNFVLDTNINLANYSWTPIGETTNNLTRFEGTFDGNGYTIYNVSVTETAKESKGAGLFGHVVNAAIKNLNVENVTIESAGEWVGGIAGYALNTTIENCTVSGGAVTGESKVGGIVGHIDGKGLYQNVVSDLVITGVTRAGGIAGRTNSAEIGIVTIEGNTVKDTTVAATGADTADEILGLDNKNDTVMADNEAINVTVLTNETVIAVSSADDLIALGGKSIEGSVYLTADIDLDGAAVPTIGAAYGKALTFEGNGYTISNAGFSHTTHNGMKHYGLFYAYTNSTLTVNNLKVENVKVDSSNDTERNYGVGIIVSYADGGSNVTLNNVDIDDCEIINNKTDIGDEAGVYVGYQTGTLTMIDCDSTGCKVAGETPEKTGAFIGMVNGTATLKNCTTDLTIGACNRVSGTLDISGGYIPKEYTVATQEDIEAALKNNNEQNIIVNLNNDVEMNASSTTNLGGVDTQSIVINGNGNKLTLTTTYWSYLDMLNPNGKLIINNAEVTSSQETGTWNSYDVAFTCNLELNDVTFEKAVALDGEGKTFVMKNVSINETNDYYALWICANGANVTIDGLNIKSAGRGIKIDGEYVNPTSKVTLNVSNAKFDTKAKAAILVDTPAGADITLNNVDISNVTADSINAVWVDSDAAAYFDNVTVIGGTKLQET